MRVVTFNAVTDRRRMYGPFQSRRIFIGVAGDAEGLWSGGDELYAGDVFIDPDLVTTGAAHGNR